MCINQDTGCISVCTNGSQFVCASAIPLSRAHHTGEEEQYPSRQVEVVNADGLHSKTSLSAHRKKGRTDKDGHATEAASASPSMQGKRSWVSAYVEIRRELGIWTHGDVGEDLCSQVQGHPHIIAQSTPPLRAEQLDPKPAIPAGQPCQAVQTCGHASFECRHAALASHHPFPMMTCDLTHLYSIRLWSSARAPITPDDLVKAITSSPSGKIPVNSMQDAILS